ncbi:hypothetical protein FGO68_gene4975 [Halteria grandinella]|uniref:Uncharacterized protein n=1 Tax=Halteria grandinella TaxID=5974 RepID=A0A8J8T6K3_HALGN|nr:hypothetical protein FGO68_gene4975 [Halteria grandinella]
MSWLMNKVFQGTQYYYRTWWHFYVGKMLSTNQGVQSQMLQELERREAIREQRYKWEILEFETSDVLDRALVRAKANRALGAIDAPTYYVLEDKINSLKKLKFTQEHEAWKDADTYEWMKYKVAAEVGGDAEREAFELFEKVQMDKKGEAGFRLWREQINKDPAAQQFLPYL